MSELNYQDLGDGIYLIDTALHRVGMAACYLIVENDEAALVDTGTMHTIPAIMELLEKLGLGADNVRYVIPTHVHLDHAGASGGLMEQCKNATLVVHPRGAPHMIDPSRLAAGATAVYGEEIFARDYGTLLPIDESRVIAAENGQEFDLAGRTLRFIDTPGHANHHGCIFDSKSRACFTGDTFGLSYREFSTDEGDFIFAPTTPVAFNPDDWQKSLDKLLALEPSAMLLTHYGRVTDIDELAITLRQSIDDFAQIAIEEETPEEGRHERIKAGITKLVVGQLRIHGCDIDEERLMGLLANDLELNAQGLEVWLKRRSKAA